MVPSAPPSVSVSAALSPGTAPTPTGTPSSITLSGGVSSVSGSGMGAGDSRTSVKSPEEQKRELLQLKVHASILELINRLKNKNEPRISNWANFVREGNAEVQVWLTKKSDAARVKLKELGFEVVLDSPNSTLMIGRLPMEKLELLAELEFVRYVSPQISR